MNSRDGPRDVADVSREALQELRRQLSRRFATVFEAWVWLCQNKLSIRIEDIQTRLATLGIAAQVSSVLCHNSADGDIVSRDFVRVLAWHPVTGDEKHRITQAEKRFQGIDCKAMGLAAAERQFGTSHADAPWLSHPTPRVPSHGRHRSLRACAKPISRTSSASSHAGSRKECPCASSVRGMDTIAFKANSKASAALSQDTLTDPAAGDRAAQNQVRAQSELIRVDMSWRRRGSNRSQYSKLLVDGAPSPQKTHVATDNKSEQTKRKKLFHLFHRHDTDRSGSLDANEVTTLLSDMGHSYDENQVRHALSLVSPAAIHFEDFCEWWTFLDWFQSQGMTEGALAMASAKYKKSEWLQEVDHVKEQLGQLLQEQHEHAQEHCRAHQWYSKRYSDEESPAVGHPGIHPSHANIASANDFFEFTQKEITRKTKMQGLSILLMNRRRSAKETRREVPSKHPFRQAMVDSRAVCSL